MNCHPFYSPPMPEWNGLSNEDRCDINSQADVYSCCCTDDSHASSIYDIIRNTLIKREKRIFQHTMKPRYRVKMNRRNQ
jgi:hypothetical protein